MSWILALLGIPALIKRIKDLEERVEVLEEDIRLLVEIRNDDLQRIGRALEKVRVTRKKR